MFSENVSTTSNWKYLEGNDNCSHIWCLLYVLKTSSKDGSDLSIASHESNVRRKLEKTDNKESSNKRMFHVEISLWDSFGHAEHSCLGSYGLACKITINRKYW